VGRKRTCAAAACIVVFASGFAVLDTGFGIGVPRCCSYYGCSKALIQAGGG
jgi:hypothetical protein